MLKYLEAEQWGKNSKIIHGFGYWEVKPGEIRKKDFRDWPAKDHSDRFPLAAVQQVHGDHVVVLAEGGRRPEELWAEEGDALITQVPEIALGIFTADCLPILLFDPVQRVIGAIHAGWRGTAKRISRNVIKEMEKQFGSRSENIQVALGPCIGPCCYEIDEPVKEAFSRNHFPWESIAHPRRYGKWLFDLAKANTNLLEGEGVKWENIQHLNFCTLCERHRFFSYRAEGNRGRQLNFIALRKAPKIS